MKYKDLGERKCLTCGATIARTRRKWGAYESTGRFLTRKYCSKSCGQIVPIGTVSIRVDSPRIGKRAFVKITETKWRKRAIVVWESVNGTLPKGYVVHHKDRDSLNDSIENLQALTKSEHAHEHNIEMVQSHWGKWKSNSHLEATIPTDAAENQLPVALL